MESAIDIWHNHTSVAASGDTACNRAMAFARDVSPPEQVQLDRVPYAPRGAQPVMRSPKTAKEKRLFSKRLRPGGMLVVVMMLLMMIIVVIVVGLIIDMATHDNNNTIISTMILVGAGISICPPGFPGPGLQSRPPLDVRASLKAARSFGR